MFIILGIGTRLKVKGSIIGWFVNWLNKLIGKILKAHGASLTAHGTRKLKLWLFMAENDSSWFLEDGSRGGATIHGGQQHVFALTSYATAYRS